MSWFPGPVELIIIFAIVIFLFGATRMKDFAKGLGESMREFRKAVKEPSGEKEGTEEAIIAAAKKMGISTEGKDIKQILKEMEEKTVEQKR